MGGGDGKKYTDINILLGVVCMDDKLLTLERKKNQFKLKGGDTESLTHSVKPSYIKRLLCGP